jgi:hypothetical protein
MSGKSAVESLGVVTAPTGVLMIVDTGLLWLWCHDRTPHFPEWRAAPEVVQSANSSIDYRIEGPDAAEVARIWAGPGQPLYLYDRPPPDKADKFLANFNVHLREKGLAASLTPLKERISHRRRIDLLLESRPVGGEIFFGGPWGAIVAGVPADRELAVVGERMPAGPDEARWRSVSVLCGDEATVARSEEVAGVAVDEARLGVFDVDAIGGWNHEQSLDGKADFVFWGRDAAAAAKELKAPPIGDGQYGWRDLLIQTAIEKGTRVEELRGRRGWKFATDFRPHSHHCQVMEQVRSSATESGTVECGGAKTCTFMTSWGDGLYRVYRDLDAANRLVRVRIDLGGEETVKRLRSVEQRYGVKR